MGCKQLLGKCHLTALLCENEQQELKGCWSIDALGGITLISAKPTLEAGVLAAAWHIPFCAHGFGLLKELLSSFHLCKKLRPREDQLLT